MFADTLTGWITGDCGSINKTINSGTFWQNQYSGTTKQLLSICVIDTQNVYIGGQNGIIVKTTNGGTNWKLLITDSTANIRTISFINNNTGWCGGTSGIGDIFRTTNGGNNWLRQTIGSNITINSICFTDNNTGCASMFKIRPAITSICCSENSISRCKISIICIDKFNSMYSIRLSLV